MVTVTEVLSKLGINVSADETRQHFDEWLDWYNGYVKKFHHYTMYNGISYVGVDRAYLGMAKTICEDWANLLLNEKVQISTDNTAFNVELENILNYSNFRVKGNQLIELAFALGTAGFVEYLDSNEKVVIDFVRAQMIYPISWDNGYVNECAFGSIREANGKKQLYTQIHKQSPQGYIIENHLFDAESGIELDLGDIEPVVMTGSADQLFQIITPNIVNNIELDSPLGISIYANAIEQIKACDLIFDSYVNEFRLGKKRIVVPQSMAQIQMQADGTMQPVFDTNDVAFTAMGIGNEDNETIHEIDMTLRASEHDQGMQKALDLLSFKCGMGSSKYKFENGTAITATEVISSKSDLYQSLRKHELVLEYALKGLTKAVAYLSGYAIKEVQVDFDDSIIIDTDAERKQDMADVSMGAMSVEEYRAKWYNESMEVASANVTSEEVME